MELYANTKLHIRVSRERSFDGISFYIFQQGENKTYQGEITFKEVKDGQRIEEAFYTSRHESQVNNVAQVLMDDLWECGIRPSEGHGSAGQLKAVENHLKDMRKITFKQLDINEQK